MISTPFDAMVVSCANQQSLSIVEAVRRDQLLGNNYVQSGRNIVEQLYLLLFDRKETWKYSIVLSGCTLVTLSVLFG